VGRLIHKAISSYCSSDDIIKTLGEIVTKLEYDLGSEEDVSEAANPGETFQRPRSKMESPPKFNNR